MTVLYVGGGNLTPEVRNRNWAQRLELSPPEVEVRVVVPREARVTLALPPNVQLRRARLPGTLGFYAAATWAMAGARRGRVDVVATSRSALSAAGWACRRIGGYRWVVDLWDSPSKEVVTYYVDGGGIRARIAEDRIPPEGGGAAAPGATV